MPIRPFKNMPTTLVEWARFFQSTSVTPDNASVGTDQLQDGAVTYAKIQNVAADSLLGNVGPAGQAQDIAVGGGIEFSGASIRRSALSGDVVVSAGDVTATVTDHAISNAKFRESNACSVVGRSTNTDGDVADIVAATNGFYLRRSGNAVGFGAIADADLPATIARDSEVTAAVAALNIASGTYTPTLTNVANLDGSTAYQCQYLRVGDIVTVSGRVDVDPTAATVETTLGISLPIASNFGSLEDCAGTAVASGIVSECAAVTADATNDRAQLLWITSSAANHGMFFSFVYQII